jgi:hypothetical protein
MSKYVASILWSIASHRRVPFGIRGDVPEWPAVFHYDCDTDSPFWIECISPVHAKDFICGADESHYNSAAKLLAEQNTEKISCAIA